jgi:hypothetical protein
VPCILGKIFELKNLRRQPSQSGKLTSFTEEIHSVPEQSYRDMNGRLTPFPVSLIVQVGCVYTSALVIVSRLQISLMIEAVFCVIRFFIHLADIVYISDT